MATEEMTPSKPAWQSKTLWMALISAVAAMVPQVQSVITSHPEGSGLVLSGIFAALRLLTKGKISIQ